jgi:hypothetical protein
MDQGIKFGMEVCQGVAPRICLPSTHTVHHMCALLMHDWSGDAQARTHAVQLVLSQENGDARYVAHQLVSEKLADQHVAPSTLKTGAKAHAVLHRNLSVAINIARQEAHRHRHEAASNSGAPGLA